MIWLIYLAQTKLQDICEGSRQNTELCNCDAYEHTSVNIRTSCVKPVATSWCALWMDNHENLTTDTFNYDVTFRKKKLALKLLNFEYQMKSLHKIQLIQQQC